MDGLEKFKERKVTNELKRSVIEEYEKDCLPLWRICVEYDVSFASVCRLEAENALLKKAKALMEEEESGQRGSGHRPSGH